MNKIMLKGDLCGKTFKNARYFSQLYSEDDTWEIVLVANQTF